MSKLKGVSREEITRFFVFKNDKENNGVPAGKAKCMIETAGGHVCGQVMDKKTFTIKRHLLRKHESSITLLGEQINRSQEVSVKRRSDEMEQKTIVKKKSKTDFKNLIIGMVIEMGAPFSSFSLPSFKRYHEEEAKQLGISLDRDGVRHVLMERYLEKKEELKSKLKDKFMFLKVDCCERLGRRYLGINIQYFEECTMEAKIYTLAVREVDQRPSGVNLKNLIHDALNRFSISTTQILAVISDNASNMICAVARLNELQINVHSDEDAEEENNLTGDMLNTQLNIEHMRCAAHTWQLVIKNSLYNCGY